MKRISYNYSKVLLICALVSIFVIVQTINTFGAEVTNHTPGEFQVGQNGSATYTIPIKVPPGINGLEPNLSLEYNSGIKNGLLGMGWSLNGISTITRGPSTLMTDGFIDGVDFDEDDRFYLNGKRLIIANEDQGYQYGDPGAEYRTEIDEFSKVITIGTAGTGPQYFEVWLKNGFKLYFGNSADSRIEAQGKDSVLIWAVNRIEDLNGNYMTVSYFEDNENGVFRPNRIDYALNNNADLVNACSVCFYYEPRIDDVPKYVSGSVIHISERLSEVQTYVNDVLIRKYHLEYEYGEVGHASAQERGRP